MTNEEREDLNTFKHDLVKQARWWQWKAETLEKENEQLKSENAALRERLEKAVELPCIEPMTTWDWDATTGLGKTNFGKYWKVLYRDEDGEFIAYMGATKEEATAMLSELKGEKKNG